MNDGIENSAGGRPVTVKDVAVHAGVSPMTVSRTLAGGVNVRPDLQEKVYAAVRELGYHRNENARSLRPGQASGLIGVGITNLSNPYYANLALGVEEIVAETGRRIILGNTSGQPERERQLVADFMGRQVEGLVLVPAGGPSEHLGRGRLGATPLVLAARPVEQLDVDVVLLDDVDGAHRGTLALLDAGHKRIGYLGIVGSTFTGGRRYQGYARAHAERSIELDPALVMREGGQAKTAVEATKYLLDLESPPTAIFSANNRNSVGALHEIGRRLRAGGRADNMPELVSFDDFELAELMPVPITVIDHDPRQLGREAARLLLDRLASGDARDRPARVIEMPVRVDQPARG